MPSFSIRVQYEDSVNWEYWGTLSDAKDENDACKIVKELDPNVVAVESTQIDSLV